ncbi:hypothetical protein ACNKHK_03795 [Shigella flexneri]
MNWRQYLWAILALNVLGLLVLFSMLMGGKPAAVKSTATAGLSWDLALTPRCEFCR